MSRTTNKKSKVSAPATRTGRLKAFVRAAPWWLWMTAFAVAGLLVGVPRPVEGMLLGLVFAGWVDWLLVTRTRRAGAAAAARASTAASLAAAQDAGPEGHGRR